MRAVILRGGVAEEQCKPMTLLSSDLQRLAGLSELPLPLRESRRRCHRQAPIADDRRIRSFPFRRFSDAVASSRKDHRSPTTGPAGQHRRQITRTPPRAWVRAPTTTAIAMLSSPAGPERSAPRWWARCSRPAPQARRCLKFCEIAGIKADGSAQDWASLYQQRIGQQTSTSHGAVPARSSATGLADGRAKPSPP